MKINNLKNNIKMINLIKFLNLTKIGSNLENILIMIGMTHNIAIL